MLHSILGCNVKKTVDVAKNYFKTIFLFNEINFLFFQMCAKNNVYIKYIKIHQKKRMLE